MNSDPTLLSSSNIVPILAAIINAVIVAAAQISTSRNVPIHDKDNKTDNYHEWWYNRLEVFKELFAIVLVPVSFLLWLVGAMLRHFSTIAFDQNVGASLTFYYVAFWVCFYAYLFFSFIFHMMRHP